MAKKASAKRQTKSGESSTDVSDGGRCYWIWLVKNDIAKWHRLPVSDCQLGYRPQKPPRDGKAPFETIAVPCRKIGLRLKRTIPCSNVQLHYCEYNTNGELVTDKCNSPGCTSCVQREDRMAIGGTSTEIRYCPGASPIGS